jgi:DNA processing protein
MKRQLTVDLLGRRLNDVEQRYAPEFLHVDGDANLLSPLATRVSIVGSRKASQEGLRRARKLARGLVEEEVVIVSGLAHGIDAAAHRGAMDAGGRTIAVLGTGIDRYYPPAHRLLQQEIATRHLVVSQFEPGAPPRRHSFPRRNRTMALVSDATVIIEAGERSGSHHQGWEALRLARPLFLLHSILDQGLAWPEEMLQYGAKVLREVEDVLDVIPSPTPDPVALAL